MEDLDELLESLREECSARIWSAGVLLARSGNARIRRIDDEELQVVVTSSSGMVSPTVSIWPAEADWSCDCPASPACSHAVGAALIVKNALESGKSFDTEQAPRGVSVGYRLTREPRGLHFARVLVTHEGTEAVEKPFAGTLAAARHQLGGKALLSTSTDFAIENMLTTRRFGVFAAGLFHRVVRRLASVSDLKLDGVAIKADGQPLRPLVILEDEDGGFLLRLTDDPSIEEKFVNGVALAAGVLRPLGESGLTARELNELPRGKRVRYDQVNQLVAEILPSLRSRIEVEVRSRRLPDEEAMPPRPRVYTERIGDALSVLPTIVYGDPPVARVDQGRLALLGEGAVPVRDMEAERRLERALSRELGLKPGHRVELEGQAALDYAERLRRWEGRVEGSQLGQFFRAPALQPHVGGRGGAELDVWFEAPYGFGDSGSEGAGSESRRIGASAVLTAWREGASLVPLNGGGFAPLPADWLTRYGAAIADLLAAREAADGELPRAMALQVGELTDELGVEMPESFEALRSRIEAFAGLGEPALPPDLKASLRPYQRDGVAWLQFHADSGLGALLADDMGLGKTLQMLTALRGRSLAIVPTSVLQNWQMEARKFRPDLRVAAYHGPNRKLDASADLTVTTYGVARIDADELSRIEWGTVVLDEAQTIKNPSSQVAKAVYRLQAEFRAALTGTPVENRLDELWSQLHFLNRGLLGSHTDFKRRYAAPIANGEPEPLERLRRRVKPFVLRRLKRDVAKDLPPRTDMVLRCRLSEEERQQYEAVKLASRKQVVEKLAAGGSVIAALEALLRLRQIACHRGLLPGQIADTSSKLQLLMGVVEEAVSENHKILVFSQWTQLLNLVEPHLRASDVRFNRLDGSTRDRQGVVDEFQDPGGPSLMLLSLKAGGTGLNLTAADLVILMDPWWNPAVEDQAADRAHRIGQENPVLVYRLVAEDTVEEKILALQDAKRQLAESVVGGAAASTMTRDDLLGLLS